MKPKIDNRTIKERSKLASEVALKIGLERNLEWLNWDGYMFLDEEGLKPNSRIGRNYAYKPIVVVGENYPLGFFFKVTVKKAYATYLRAI